MNLSMKDSITHSSVWMMVLLILTLLLADNQAGASAGYGTGDSLLMDSDFYGQLVGSNGYNEDGVYKSGMVRRASMNSHDWVGAFQILEYNKG